MPFGLLIEKYYATECVHFLDSAKKKAGIINSCLFKWPDSQA
jgi:hypothetical protein